MTTEIAPQVSICLPIYNGAKYLRQAIESALAQTYSDFELIICDDRSTDNSFDIARQYAKRDARIKLTKNVHRLGLFNNYNACLAKAQGQYIKLFAQDDLFEPQIIQKMVARLESYPNVALVSCAKKIIDDHGKEVKTVSQFQSDQLLRGADVIVSHLVVLGYSLANWVGEPSTTMFRASDLGKKFDSKFYHYGDIDYWFRILEKGYLLYLAEPLCSFRRHEESSTSSNLKGLYFASDIHRLGTKYQKYLAELGETPEHFGKRAAEVIALNLDHLVRNEGLNLEDTLAAGPCSLLPAGFEEMSHFRAALFYSERRVTSLLEELIATQNELEHRQAECNRLWEALNQLTNSVSWKLTAPLRNVRAKMGPSKQ
jgi:glycosyltransferase involved in cell wall biosynthesis